MNSWFDEEFKNPSAEFRGAPFWGWNGALDKDIMKQQLDDFRTMGFGGYHIHSRIGLQDEYLGETFMEGVRFCHEYAKSIGMKTYLYDEDKWPSGSGAGRATKEKQYRAKYILFSAEAHEDGHYISRRPAANRLTENGTVRFLAAYAVRRLHGELEGFHFYSSRVELEEAEMSSGDEWTGSDVPDRNDVWYAYLVTTDKLPWFNNEAYLDTLNPKATERFLEVAYDPYAKEFGEDFSQSIPSIFTDEPQFVCMQSLDQADDREEIVLPFTEEMEELYHQKYGHSLVACIPNIVWNLPGNGISPDRYQYLDLLAESFATGYSAVLGKWCEEHGIDLAGHLMMEDGLEMQLRSVGEAMRSYPYFQRPGIDVLANGYEYTTAKQAQSIVHQMNKPAMYSELYGVTNWDFDFKGHKLQGDWQAALGVTVRVPHLAWMYMGGESKRDYPAPIDAHSPWYRRYSLIEDYFSRINVALAQGKPRVRVAVLHPIESMFMAFGPQSQCAAIRRKLEEQFQQLTRWLLFGLIDFDFVSERVLCDLYRPSVAKAFGVGEMAYDAVIIPELITIREHTLSCLQDSCRGGATVIAIGEAPSYMDGRASVAPQQAFQAFQRIPFVHDLLMDALEPFRDLDLLDRHGLRTEDMIYQMREAGEEKLLFLAHGMQRFVGEKSVENQRKSPDFTLRIPGMYRAQLYDAQTGEIRELSGTHCDSCTLVPLFIHEQDSFLIRFTPASAPERKSDETRASFGEEKLSKAEKCTEGMESVEQKEKDRKHKLSKEYLASEVMVTLEEPNVLLLDMAEYRLDQGEWHGEEEILRLDDRIREGIGYHKRSDSFPQPWLSREENKKEHMVFLRFAFWSETEGIPVSLAWEGEDDCRVFWNDAEIAWRPKGFYVDSVIRLAPVGELRQGWNTLLLEIPFGVLTNLENVFLLGDFNVRIYGREAIITKRKKPFGWGSLKDQGAPFYGGNILYESQVELPEGEVILTVDDFKGALVEASMDGGAWKETYTDPYQIRWEKVEKGRHIIRIRCYGNRYNTFGQLHNCNHKEIYYGPRTWRTEGNNWSYEYRLKDAGILKAPGLTSVL